MEDDADLYQRWGEGDRGAGAALIERHYASIERFFSHKAGDRADDLVQQTFLACTESASRFRGEGSFRAFLFGVARNVLCGHIRRRVRDGREVPDFTASSLVDLMPGVSTLVSREAAHRHLALALQRIPLDLQILIELYYWEELSVDELAQMMEVPPGTIKSRLFRARGALRDALEAMPSTADEVNSARTLVRRWIEEVREHVPDAAAG